MEESEEVGVELEIDAFCDAERRLSISSKNHRFQLADYIVGKEFEPACDYPVGDQDRRGGFRPVVSKSSN
jgi:hypothetical protein